mmetsp:Transcript_15994/g.40115  ORF Transcript_15994/g.40115 Transcript_15994/m.40115 type:complete len:91 (+) Transcript_15994:4735-5007(+)
MPTEGSVLSFLRSARREFRTLASARVVSVTLPSFCTEGRPSRPAWPHNTLLAIISSFHEIDVSQLLPLARVEPVSESVIQKVPTVNGSNP